MPSQTGTLKNGNQVGVILLHGLTGMPSELKPVAKHLTKLGYLVETPILPGHGAGHQELLKTGWKDWVECARQAVDSLASRCDRVFVGGLSMGALLSVVVTANDPRIDGLIILSPTLSYDGQNTSPWGALLWLVDFFPFCGRLGYWTKESPFGLKDERLQKQILKSAAAAERGDNTQFGLVRTYAGSLRQLELLVKEVRKNAGKVQCPAVFVHSLEDTLVTIKNSFDLCTMLGSTDKTVYLLGGCDHVLTLDLRRKDVAKFVGEFLTRLAPLSADAETSMSPVPVN